MCSALPANHWFGSWDQKRLISGSAAEIATLKPVDWRHLSAGSGTKGPRLHDWAYLELADLDASEFNEERSGLWRRAHQAIAQKAHIKQKLRL